MQEDKDYTSGSQAPKSHHPSKELPTKRAQRIAFQANNWPEIQAGRQVLEYIPANPG